MTQYKQFSFDLVWLQFDLDSMWSFVFGDSASVPSAKLELCPEAAVVILAMVRAMLNQVSRLVYQT